MKTCIFFILLFLSVNFGFAQNTLLRILGQSDYTEYSEGGVAFISTQEVTLDKIDTLKARFKALGKYIKLEKVTKPIPENKVQFKVEEDDVLLFNSLLVLCRLLRIDIDTFYFKMPEHLFEEEDAKAIKALKNANIQAKIIANNLGFRVDKILNIDDETTYASSLYDNIELDTERGQLMVRLIDILGRRGSLYESESTKQIRKGGYSIWVTYSLIPK